MNYNEKTNPRKINAKADPATEADIETAKQLDESIEDLIEQCVQPASTVAGLSMGPRKDTH